MTINNLQKVKFWKGKTPQKKLRKGEKEILTMIFML